MSTNTVLTPKELPSNSREIHPGGAQRLNAEIHAFAMTMQHAIRSHLHRDLERIYDEIKDSFINPDTTILDVFDYESENRPDFYNWLFPYCPYILTAETLTHIQTTLVENIRRNLQQDAEQ